MRDASHLYTACVRSSAPRIAQASSARTSPSFLPRYSGRMRRLRPTKAAREAASRSQAQEETTERPLHKTGVLMALWPTSAMAQATRERPSPDDPAIWPEEPTGVDQRETCRIFCSCRSLCQSDGLAKQIGASARFPCRVWQPLLAQATSDYYCSRPATITPEG